MPTNLAIDDRLLEEAQKVGGHRTKKETVTVALQEYIAQAYTTGNPLLSLERLTTSQVLITNANVRQSAYECPGGYPDLGRRPSAPYRYSDRR